MQPDVKTKNASRQIIQRKYQFYEESLGSFSIDDGDGSENVTFKMNWRFFKLFRVYSNSVKMSKESKFL